MAENKAIHSLGYFGLCNISAICQQQVKCGVARLLAYAFALLLAASAFLPCAQAEEKPARITILYDAFGKPSHLERGWGYSALIEYAGKRILFDTGGRTRIFAENVNKLNVNLESLDFVVISHRHDDHTAGLAYVLQKNPKINIYVPLENGSFGAPVPAAMKKAIERGVKDAPANTRYFDGQYVENYLLDSHWPGANFIHIDDVLEVVPGFFLFRTISDNKGTMELSELSLAIKTPEGMLVIVGCSHPGIEKILAKAAGIDVQIHALAGGLHLIGASDHSVIQVVNDLKQKWQIKRIAAGHCSGEFAQSEFKKQFGMHHDYAGLGEVIILSK